MTPGTFQYAHICVFDKIKYINRDQIQMYKTFKDMHHWMSRIVSLEQMKFRQIEMVRQINLYEMRPDIQNTNNILKVTRKKLNC